ncbi:hypothetical protein OGAPHI_003635 [Ogataea philodendri]|uniref:Uncharacterized protein n=1 Tax=Ogataea philodendri TaxID=1378263 RepID=A0A9P8T515_9ASCO|nr:uncharacterized protein OGAPHI_003635 [Ogataea philodendri]KAH3665451.1 hypothetical protein OGAPHI_003635 [Ogataea philodendri]
MLHKLKSMDQLQREANMEHNTFAEREPEPAKSLDEKVSFTSFLERVSHNKDSDTISVKYTRAIPEFIIRRYDSNQIILNRPEYASVTTVEQKIASYREEVKERLKLHYLNRLFDILDQMGFVFKTRSTNWKSGKFYAQMLCQQDVGNKRKDLSLLVEDAEENESESDTDEVVNSSKSEVSQPRNMLLYPCHSRLNYSFDSVNGQFSLEYNHLNHQHLPTTNPSDPKSIVHPQNSAVNIASVWAKKMSQEPQVPDQSDNASRTKQLVAPEPRDNGASKVQTGSALANALNYLHRNISSKESTSD